MNFTGNWCFAERYMKAIQEILQENAKYIVKVEVATPEEDMKQSTDLKVVVKAGAVAVRVRRKKKTFRDITIRAFNRGRKTEIHKLKDGFGDWYLYTWECEGDTLEWVLLDINKMRSAGMFEGDRYIQMNDDGVTGFIVYSLKEIREIGALVNEHWNLPVKQLELV